MKYAAPIGVTSGSGITWASADSTIATVSGNDMEANVTAVKTGSTTITATAGGKSVTVPVTVEAYKASDRMAGAAAYAKIPGSTMSCAAASCHGPTGVSDITPSGIGKHTDQAIQAAFAMGANPEGGNVSIGVAAHSFAIPSSDPAYLGIVAFLRSEPAAGIPKADN